MQRFLGSVLATLSLALAAGAGCSSNEDDAGSDDGTSGSGGSAQGGSAGSSNGGSNNGGAGTAGTSAGTGGTAGTNATGGSGASGGTGMTGGASGSSTGGSSTGGSSGSSGSGTGGSSGSSTGKSSAAELARKLGRAPNFMIGMGNDLNNDHSQDGAYTLGVTMDMHYAYLVGLPGEGGWPDWNAGGTFVNILTDSADAEGTTPMFDMYGMAAHGEANQAVLIDPGYM